MFFRPLKGFHDRRRPGLISSCDGGSPGGRGAAFEAGGDVTQLQ